MLVKFQKMKIWPKMLFISQISIRLLSINACAGVATYLLHLWKITVGKLRLIKKTEPPLSRQFSITTAPPALTTSLPIISLISSD